MERITIENIEKEIEYILDHKPLSSDNLEQFVLLCKAMKYMNRVHREFTENDAREWAKQMNPAPRWSLGETTAVMSQYNYRHRPFVFWIVMNLLYSDYGKIFLKHNIDKPEIWADMANAFIEDQDAADDKVGRYWRDIVKH